MPAAFALRPLLALAPLLHAGHALRPAAARGQRPKHSDWKTKIARNWSSKPSPWHTYGRGPLGWLRGERELCAMDVRAGNDSCMFITHKDCGRHGRAGAASAGAYRECMRPHETCALVGSSAHLLDAAFGEEIDGHETVIRMNSATSGASDASLAMHVGNRTGVRFVNGFGLYPDSDRREGVCHFHHELSVPARCGGWCWRQPRYCRSACSVADLAAGTRCTPFAATSPVPYFPVILDQADAYLADELVGIRNLSRGKYTTAGFKGFAYALRTCRRLTIYGFGPSCRGAVGARYHDPVNPKESKTGVIHKAHPYGEEFDMLRRVSGLAGGSPSPLLLQGWVRAKTISMRLPACLATSGGPVRLVKRPGGKGGLAERTTVDLSLWRSRG